MKRYKCINIFCLLFISLLINSCGSHGCKYPDEIKAGGFWDTTLTTIVRPINRNVIETENSIGEYTLKKGTTEAMANSNLWVPLQNTDGTYATIEAGKKMKLSVSGAVSLTGYQQNLSVNFQDWISAGTSPFSFAPINLVSKKGADIKIVEIKKKYTFRQNGSYDIDTIYTTENGDVLFNLDKDTADISEDCKTEETEQDLSINYAFFLPKKIVFDEGFFYPYYIKTASSSEETGSQVVATKTPLSKVEIESGIKVSVDKVDGKYYYFYTFTYKPNNEEEKLAVLLSIYNTLKGNSSSLSKSDFVKYYSDNNYASKTDASNIFVRNTSSSATTISFEKFATIHPEYERKYIYSRLIKPTIYANEKELKNVFKKIAGTKTNISKNEFTDYWVEQKFFLASEAEAVFEQFEKDGKMEESHFVDAMKNFYGYPNFQERLITSQVPSSILSCVKCDDAIGGKFNYGKQFSPVSIYFKDYNDVFGSKYAETYNGNEYQSYFYQPEYVLDRRNQEVSAPSGDKYANRFISSWHNTGSKSKNIFNSSNCRIFPKNIAFQLQKITKHINWKDKITDENQNTYVALSETKQVPLVEYCSKYCLDLCSAYFQHKDVNSSGKIDAEFTYNGEKTSGSFYFSDTGLKEDNPSITDWSHFFQYSPVDAKGTELKKEIKKTGCSCDNYSDALTEVDKVAASKENIRDVINRSCSRYGWSGLYAKYNDAGSSSSSMHYDLNQRLDVDKFTIVKHLFKYSGSDLYISYLLCSPYDRALGRCTQEEQCQDGNRDCSNMGWFYANGQAVLDDNCPMVCEQTTGYTVHGKSDITSESPQFKNQSFDVVAVIDYRHSKEKKLDPRKSSNADDADNSIYYRVNNGEDIEIFGHSKLNRGLIPIGGADVTGISCYDSELPVEEISIEEIFDKRDKNCKVSGSFSTYTSGGQPKHHLYYTPQSKGILPIKWSSFNVRPGDILPITIRTAGSGSLPALIKNENCDKSSCYMSLTNGNGLAIVLEADDVKIVNENIYKHPEYWMCNYGLSGSYGGYTTYAYKTNKNIAGNILRLDFIQSRHNNRGISSTTWGLEWQCRDSGAEYLWFSGYDFKNFKKVSRDIFPQPHIYSVADLNLFLTDFNSDEGVVVSNASTKIDKVECGEDGVPDAIYFTNGNVIYKKENEISVDAEGRNYKYTNSSGNVLSIAVDSDDIQRKVWPTLMPTKLVFTQDGKENTVTYTKNNLKRKNKEGVKYVYQYFLQDSNIIREISVNNPSILQVSCLDNGEDGISFVETSNIVKRISANDCGVSCISSEDKTEIYTPYGPFSGLNKDTSTGTLPAIYSTYGMCNNKMDDIGTGFIYDTEEINHISTYREEIKGIERKPLDIFWRVEFNTPELENDKESFGSSNLIIDSRCSANAVPDVMYIDLTKTFEWQANLEKKNAPTIAVHKDNNSVFRTKKNFYTITYSPWGWNNEVVSQYDTRIVDGGITCGGFANCDESEIPEIEIVNNGETVKLMDMTKHPKNGNSVIKVSTIDVVSFSYFDKQYSIKTELIPTDGKLCNLDSVLSWLSYLVSDGKTIKLDSDELVNFGKAPYSITCSGRTDDTKELANGYQYPYTIYSDTDLSLMKLIKLRDTNKIIFAGKTDNSDKATLVLTTNNQSYLSDKYFAHCTPSWQTPGWMLLTNSGDMSSFSQDFNGLSGSFISKPNETLTWDKINKSYTIENVWSKYGGIITNSIYNSKCDKYDIQQEDKDNCSDCGNVYVNCKHEGSVSVKHPKFKAVYDKQIIAVKTLGSDPINATDTNCKIQINSSNSSNNGNVVLLANEPFGNVMPTDIMKEIPPSKVEMSVEDVEKQTENIVQPAMTVNGDIYHQDNFFKKTEMYRNIIGAGIVKPEWHIVGKNGDMKNISVFQKGETISITPSSDYFYTMGNLNHDSSSYCVDYKNGKVIGLLADVTISLEQLSSGLSLVPGPADVYGEMLKLGLKGLKNISNNSGKMTPISLNKNRSTNEASKRQCGTGMAFRVIPVPNFLCKKGFNSTCSNKRINIKYGSDTEQIKDACRTETEVDWKDENITVGRCYIQEFDIVKFDSAKNEYSLKYNGSMYKMNSFSIVGNENDNSWNETENIYKDQCGLCLPESNTSFFNGVHFLTTDVPAIPSDVRTKEQCQNYKDNKGNKYVWATSYAKRTPFESYTKEKQQEMFNALNNVFRTSLTSCVEETDNNFQINFTNEEYYNNFLAVFNIATTRNEPSCIASLESFFYKQMQLACRSESCINVMQNSLAETARQGCNKMFNMIEGQDGKYFSKFLFSKNKLYTVCKDDKIINDSENKNDYHSLTRVGVSKSLQDYGYAELTDAISNISGDENGEGLVHINVHIPTTLKGKQLDPNKNKLHVGFAFAGRQNDDPLLLYKDYKLREPIDLQRGYDLQLGNGTSNKNGKYLYFYIQPNASDGKPDPAFEPNAHFNLQAPNAHGKQYTKEEILEDPAVHHFVDYDQNKDGVASIVAEDSGKIWLAVLDVDEKDENGVSISDDRDGKAIVFENELETKVNGDNVLGTNSGFYKVYAKIQGEDNDYIGQFINYNSSSKVGETTGIVASLFVNPIKHILFGVEDGSEVKKFEGWFSKQLHFNKDSEEGSGEGDKDTFLKKEDKSSLQKKGLLYQIIKIVLSFSLLHTLFYILMVGNAILFGIQVVLGQHKLDSQNLIKYLLRFSFIYMVLRPSALEFYFNVIVVGIMNISDGLIAMVASNFTDNVYYKNSTSAAGVAFGPVENILKFWFHGERVEQAIAILCSSWFGWISVLLLLTSLVHFLISLFEAIAVYIISLLLLLLQLALGPIQFFFLIFDKTSGKFWAWLKGIAGIIAQQTALFSALAIFATVYYHILKGALNFPYCWEPVLKIPILNIPLLYAWKIAGTLPVHMAEMMGEYGPTGQGAIPSVGFSPLTGICIFLLTATMSKFIEKSAQFGASLFGTQNIASAVIGLAQQAKSFANKKASSAMKSGLKEQLSMPKEIAVNIKNRIKSKFY